MLKNSPKIREMKENAYNVLSIDPNGSDTDFRKVDESKCIAGTEVIPLHDDGIAFDRPESDQAYLVLLADHMESDQFGRVIQLLSQKTYQEILKILAPLTIEYPASEIVQYWVNQATEPRKITRDAERINKLHGIPNITTLTKENASKRTNANFFNKLLQKEREAQKKELKSLLKLARASYVSFLDILDTLEKTTQNFQPIQRPDIFKKITWKSFNQDTVFGKGTISAIGKWCYNSGVIAYVDGKGDYYVCAPSDFHQEAEKILEGSKYVNSTIYVPGGTTTGKRNLLQLWKKPTEQTLKVLT